MREILRFILICTLSRFLSPRPVSFLLLKGKKKKKECISLLNYSINSHTPQNKLVMRSSFCVFHLDAALPTQKRKMRQVCVAGRSLVGELITGKGSLP